MTIGKWLLKATNTLKIAGINSARLDSLILLEDATNLDRSNLLAHPNKILQGSSLMLLNEWVERRKNREPLAYIRGFCEFYGHKFIVSPDVMIPRPESEVFLELLSKLKPDNNQKLLDVGTGSGCLAISAKLLFPGLKVDACDMSKNALKVANNNANNLKADIKFTQSDLLTNIKDKYDYVFANLPYVPTKYSVSKEVNYEPTQAIYSNNKGLELIKSLAIQAKLSLNNDGYIFIESLLEQQKEIEKLFNQNNYNLVNKKGLIQIFNKT